MKTLLVAGKVQHETEMLSVLTNLLRARVHTSCSPVPSDVEALLDTICDRTKLIKNESANLFSRISIHHELYHYKP